MEEQHGGMGEDVRQPVGVEGAGSLGPQSASDLPLSLCLPSPHFPSLCSLSRPLCLWGGGQRGYFHGKSSTTTTLPTSPPVTGGRMRLWAVGRV